MSMPVVKIGKYVGAGVPISNPIGFIPDTLIIQAGIPATNGNMYICNPNLTKFSNGTATLINSAISQLTTGSYVTAMGPMNVGSTKQRGFTVGNKLALNGTTYIYTAFRSDSGEQGGL